MGKAIYKPIGKAGEYAKWACNYYLGCSNDCDYCYCKQGVLGTVAGGNKPFLKASFKDENDAISSFMKELTEKADTVRKEGGLFFSFTSDPLLPDTIALTMKSVKFATGINVPCHILTKCADWALDKEVMDTFLAAKDKIAIGFTLTGMDSMERGKTVASNRKRILVLGQLHELGFKTFASIEPVIDIDAAARVISESAGACDMFKIGTLKGKTDYDSTKLKQFALFVDAVCQETGTPVYWKNSFKGVYSQVVDGKMTVGVDYDIFSGK